jgi:hypothetical protein
MAEGAHGAHSEHPHEYTPKPNSITVATPEPASDSDPLIPRELQDLDQYTSKGAPATKKEVWSYYAYYAGNNGIGSFQ